MKEFLRRVKLAWSVFFAPRFVGVDYGNIDTTAHCVWFKHGDKVYITDIIVTENNG